jgi:UDP-glucose 4-epimerase
VRVLITGHRGKIGACVMDQLLSRGDTVVGFDLAEGADLLDLDELKRAADGSDAVVHLGALAHDSAGTPERIMAVNVLGTWHVLLAAEAAGAGLVIHFSSIQALGIAEGERPPDYFPIDDAHPRRAMRPYGLSKRLAEDLCQGFTARTGIATLSLRPVTVWEAEDYSRVRRQREVQPRSEWEPYWEYGGFVDVHDVAMAVQDALEAQLSGHHRALLCAADISASAPSLELAARLTPSVPVRDPERYTGDPWSALFDCQLAETVLGWRPHHRWRPGPD